MLQVEIDEISEAFLDAWKEFFATPMYYIPFDEETTSHSIYNENKVKKYKEEEAVMFHGIIKEREDLDITSPIGKSIEKEFEITIVTKELVDAGVLHVNSDALVRYVDRHGREYLLRIFDEYSKVQFGDNKIFTKLKVKYYE